MEFVPPIQYFINNAPLVIEGSATIALSHHADQGDVHRNLQSSASSTESRFEFQVMVESISSEEGTGNEVPQSLAKGTNASPDRSNFTPLAGCLAFAVSLAF